MNAAYLMLTTAWLAGQNPAPPAAAPVTPVPQAAVQGAPVVSAPIGGGCGGGCGCATDACCGEHESKWAKLKAKFKKGGDCGCGCEAAPAKHAWKGASSCGCDECGGGKAKAFWEKFKGKFKKHGDCGCGCESSCGCGGGATGGVIMGGTAPERIPAAPAPGGAKPMPTPAAPGTGSVMGNGVIVTPVVAPRLSSEQPF